MSILTDEDHLIMRRVMGVMTHWRYHSADRNDAALMRDLARDRDLYPHAPGRNVQLAFQGAVTVRRDGPPTYTKRWDEYGPYWTRD